MGELLLFLTVLAVVAVLVLRFRRRGRGGGPSHPAAVRDARERKAATDQAIISRQGGQGGHQGGVGGGYGL